MILQWNDIAVIMILQEWLNANFKKTERRELVIIKSENVLTPKSLQKVSWCPFLPKSKQDMCLINPAVISRDYKKNV